MRDFEFVRVRDPRAPSGGSVTTISRDALASERTAARGRPTEMAPIQVLERIRRLARRTEGLFRIHRTHSALYARARRQFGSWADAVAAAGLDYGTTLGRARQRSLDARRLGRRKRRMTQT